MRKSKRGFCLDDNEGVQRRAIRDCCRRIRQIGTLLQDDDRCIILLDSLQLLELFRRSFSVPYAPFSVLGDPSGTCCNVHFSVQGVWDSRDVSVAKSI